MTAHLDQFALLCRQAAGLEVPPPPEIPGRVHVQREKPPQLEDLPELTAKEVADLVCINLAAATRRIERARAAGDWSALLELAAPHELRPAIATTAAAKGAAPATKKRGAPSKYAPRRKDSAA